MALDQRHSSGRRSTDRGYISDDQKDELINEIKEAIILELKAELGNYVINTGRGMFGRFIFFIGALTIVGSIWLSKHGINI
jgi:hypothetical protein